MGNLYQITKVLNDVTATTTSVAVPIAGAKKIVLVYKRADHGSGKTVFSAQVSLDGVNYITYNKWITNATNAITEGQVRVASVDTGTANATGFLTMSPEDGFLDIKVTATETTDGTHSAWLYIEY
jgi:hypothetical protein